MVCDFWFTLPTHNPPATHPPTHRPGLPIEKCDPDPWVPCQAYGVTGGTLRDKTCGEVARYIARLVGWFTQGGCHDECGAWHESGHRYEWAVLSVLNEVQHEHFGPSNGGKPGPAFGVDAAKACVADLGR